MSIKDEMLQKLQGFAEQTEKIIDSVLKYHSRQAESELKKEHDIRYLMLGLLQINQSIQKAAVELDEHQKFQQKIIEAQQKCKQKDEIIVGMFFQVRMGEVVCQETLRYWISKPFIVLKYS